MSEKDMQTDNKSSPNALRLKFRTVLQLEGKNATGIHVPPEIVTALGASKRPPVLVTIHGYTYRTTIAPYNAVFMIPVSAENRANAAIAAGDEIEVEVELDMAPREVTLPADFSTALEQDADARSFFDGLSYSNKRRIVLSIEEAKTEETRQRRIAKAISDLHAGKI
jgi:hypothetical protein